MRTRILAAALLLSCTAAFSQEKSPSLSIATGIAAPVGNFKNTDSSGSEAGFAKAGPFLRVEMSWPVSKRLSFVAAVHGQLNPLNARGLEKAFNNMTIYRSDVIGYASGGGMPIFPDATPGAYKNWKFEKGNWISAGLYAGAGVNVPLSNNVSFTGNLLIGAMYVFKPEGRGVSQSATDNATFYQSKKGGIGFSYQANAGINWKVTDRLSLFATIGYLGAPAVKFRNVHTVLSTTHYSGGIPVSATESFNSNTLKQSVSTVNFTIGLRWRLGK
jgi:opacity protein-like surface antigen